jgi:calcineurin-like phosphoesterase family protein
MAIYMTSDHHFGHDNILHHEPKRKELFGTIDRMNQELVERWNSVVGKGDVVHYLGDFSMKIKYVEEFLPRLNGLKLLLGGNHDKVFADTKQQYLDRLMKAGFHSVDYSPMRLPITFENHGTISIAMSHYPYLEDEAEVAKECGYALRYEDIRPPKLGDLLLHGHVHGRWKFRPHCINVGVDVWDYYPVKMETAVDEYFKWMESQRLTSNK